MKNIEKKFVILNCIIPISIFVIFITVKETWSTFWFTYSMASIGLIIGYMIKKKYKIKPTKRMNNDILMIFFICTLLSTAVYSLFKEMQYFYIPIAIIFGLGGLLVIYNIIKKQNE